MSAGAAPASRAAEAVGPARPPRRLRQDEPTVRLPPEERRKDIVWVRPVLTASGASTARAPATASCAMPSTRACAQTRLAERERGTRPASPAPRQRWVSDEDLASVWVTNPDRVMFGAGGPAKLELALYYARVGDWMLPELALRPVSLLRCPTGKAADCFFQRHAMSGMPEAIRQISLREEGSKERADYLYLENARGLLALAQFGAVELHSWGCRVDKPERPDRMVFDLDPDEGLPWRQVVDAALRGAPEPRRTSASCRSSRPPAARACTSWWRWPGGRPGPRCAASPRSSRSPWRAGCRSCSPANMAKSSRRGRIFLDYLRNGRSATAVAAYSLRARPGVPASTPVTWEELVEIDEPADLNYATVPVRLTEVDDPWAELARSARPLTKEMERRLQAAR